jgi:eukaryotic-like serine/threonine-protein kinase
MKRIFQTAFNTYKEAGLIGQGGAGYIVSAIDIDGITFAIKLLNVKEGSRSRLKRFHNEINFCQKTDHPNIMKVIDYGTFDEVDNVIPFYVMKK